MPCSRPSRTDAALLLIMAAGACGLALSSSPHPAQRFIPAANPAAVLAWVETRCPVSGALRPDASRVHAEDLIAVAAAFESRISYLPLADVCAEALAIAGSAAPPQHTGVAEALAKRLAAR